MWTPTAVLSSSGSGKKSALKRSWTSRFWIQAKIVLNIFRDGNRLVIRVINDGVLTKEDRERIDQLLDGRVEAERSVSLGIRNVNKRLKIIYGESFGLTIKNDNEGHTVSTLVVGLQAVRE